MFGPLFRKTMICGVVAIFDIGCMPLMVVSWLMAIPDPSSPWLIPCIAATIWGLFGVPFAGMFVHDTFKHDPDDPRPIRWARYIASHEWFGSNI